MKHEIEPEKMLDTSRPSELTEAQQRLLNSLHLEPPKKLQSVGSGTVQVEKIPSATVNIPSQAPEAKDLPNTRWQQSTVGMSL